MLVLDLLFFSNQHGFYFQSLECSRRICVQYLNEDFYTLRMLEFREKLSFCAVLVQRIFFSPKRIIFSDSRPFKFRDESRNFLLGCYYVTEIPQV